MAVEEEEGGAGPRVFSPCLFGPAFLPGRWFLPFSVFAPEECSVTAHPEEADVAMKSPTFG